MSGPRPQRGVVFPSPVVMITVVAVAMAALAFVLTRHHAPTERAITASSQPSSSASAHPHAGKHHRARAHAHHKPAAPAIKRASVPVVVFNNSGITGLAAQVGAKVHAAGWDLAGADNWYGSIPTTTVYYPARLEAAAKQLALDLGVGRTAPSVAPMPTDRLTLILTGPLKGSGSTT